MDLNKTKSLLKKINRLYDLINEMGEASETEKDLIKAYVVDLYGAVISDDNEDLEKQEMLKKIKKQKKLEKKLSKKKAKKENKAVEQEDEVAFDIVKQEEVKAPKAEVETLKSKPVVVEDTLEPTEYNEVKEALKPASIKVAPQVQPAVSGALAELFEINSGDDLSDKLSQTPISDLTKAMGINEKIFTVNELFGGNSEEMNNMLVALNGLKSFDEAKSILLRSVASKYDWANTSKVKKAKTFIKLIQRRYN